LHNVRSHELTTYEFANTITIILGPNGTGKTTILEALYLLLRGTSFRGRDRDMIAHSHGRAIVKLTVNDTERRGELRISDGRIAKEFVIEDKKQARLSATQRHPVVLFEPDELRLLTSSPQRRRDFIDGIIARLSPTYSAVLSRYQRALAQRNELLKQYDTMTVSDWEAHLFAWDVKLSELGATIIKARLNFLKHSNEHLSRIYSDMANSKHMVVATYVGPLTVISDSLQQLLLDRLESNRKSDALRGYTSSGPHRDDITLYLDGHAASEAASRGELRTIMLSFKLLEVELQAHHSGQKPLILLDDVFSELDITREQYLMDSLKGYQTVITATDLRNELKAHAAIITLN
jgi:DNA replication and repair protein RecF